MKLENTWHLKAVISDIRDVKAGAKLGYGSEYTAKSDMKIAVIGVGYADGFTVMPVSPLYRQGILKLLYRRMKFQPTVVIGKRKVTIVGRVAMQIITVDITKLKDVHVGGEVTIPAMRIPTNPLIPRIYV